MVWPPRTGIPLGEVYAALDDIPDVLPFESFGEEWPPWVPRQMVDVELPWPG